MAKTSAKTAAKTPPKAPVIDRPFAPPNWPASKVVMWPIAKIKPYPKNPMIHPKAQIDALALDMRTDGVTTAILVDEKGEIIYGHARRLAAIENGFTEYPVMQALGWTDAQKRATRIKDNQRARQSDWDIPTLRLEVGDLKLAGFDLPLLGFPDASLRWMADGQLVVDPAAEWAGMPQFSQGDHTAFRSIVVHFKDQESVDLFAKATKQKINEKTKFLWYPHIEIVPFVKVGTKPK